MLIDHGHRHGLEVFLSMPVNDIHDGQLPEGDPLLSPMKRAHPDWLLGKVDNPYAEGRYSGLSQFGYNFGIDEVREYRLAIAEVAIKNYDLDGFDWDFCRFPRFFKKGTSRDNAHLMTDLMRSIRSVMTPSAEVRLNRDRPKSPVNALPIQMRYCRTSGLSNPIARPMAA